MMKALVYLRVSTEEQAEKGYSILAQRSECIKKAIELGCSLEDIQIFSDEGVSGAVLERPQLMAAMSTLKNRSNKIDFFICYDSSRLSRNASHQLIIVDEVKKSGTQLILIRNSFEDNAEGRFQLTVMAAVDEYERARLRLRTEMGKRVKAAQHRLTHNPGIYGYDFDTKTDNLNINDENSQCVKLMYKMLVEERKGPAEIAELLNSMELMSPRMKSWNRVTVRRILTNQSYLGVLYIRRYDTRDCHLNKFRKKEDKIKIKERPRSEWIPVPIPQLIDKDTWEKAQAIMGGTRQNTYKENDSSFILTPLLKCGACGSTMNGKRITKGNCCYRYYVCSEKYKKGKTGNCSSKLVRADKIEKAVWDFVHSNIFYYIRKEINIEKIIKDYIEDKDNSIMNISNKKEKAKNEKKRIITMYQKGYISDEEMELKLENQDRRLLLLEEDLINSAETSKPFLQRLRSGISREEAFNIMEAALDKLDSKGRKNILGLIVREIVTDGCYITIR